MNSLAKKVASILPALESRGAVYLFAFAERAEVDLWDVVLSSEWSDNDWSGGIEIVVDLLWPLLSLNERVMITQIAVVPSSDPRVQEMPDSLDGVTPQDEKVIYVSLLGSDVRRAFIFKAQHAPVTLPATSEMVVAHG